MSQQSKDAQDYLENAARYLELADQAREHMINRTDPNAGLEAFDIQMLTDLARANIEMAQALKATWTTSPWSRS